MTVLLAALASATATAQVATEHARGQAIYNQRCYFCHGYAGDAQTLASTVLSPPPRNFRATPLEALDRQRMLDAVTHGRPGTAMKGFAGLLAPAQVQAVVDFVRAELMTGRSENVRYHTPENGWREHERFRDAFPFATGATPLDTPWETLSASERSGKARFLTSCISCHDRARVTDEGPVWQAQAISYPRGGYRHDVPVDGYTGATPYAIHDRAPVVAGLDPVAREGEAIYQQNCAFCHAADGTGRNWIGSFLERRPRDLTDPAVAARLTPDRVRQVIREGLAGTSMPAWRNVLSEHQIGAVEVYVRRVLMARASP